MPDEDDPSPEELLERQRWFEEYGHRLEHASTVRRPDGMQRFACPCCGHLTLAGRGGFEICPVCFWEDDGQDDGDAATVRGGPNGPLSLEQARRNYASFGASDECHRGHVRAPRPDELVGAVEARPMSRPVFVLDGSRFDTLEGFFQEVEAVLALRGWGRNLDALNDVLRGGFGTPEGGFVLRWLHSARSREALGHAATARWLERRLQGTHPADVAAVGEDLERARARKGKTLFDILVEIVRAHGPGGPEEGDGVELQLL